jgi:hypothetical protein
MFYIKDRKNFDAKIQAPFVLAGIRALRSSIFKNTPEIQRALVIAGQVERKYDLNRADLFVPALETTCAFLEPLSGTMLTGTLRRVGYEIFPQYVSILGIPASSVKAAMGLKEGVDLLRAMCTNYSQAVVGADAGAMTLTITDSGATVTDTTFLPCPIQIGSLLGGGQVTGLFRANALVEKRCRAKGDTVCTFEYTPVPGRP